jgi:hypothetical protein
MATLIPCIACRRHLRHSEAQCPFCGAQQPLTAPSARQITIPRDASRATIFALSLTLLGQACGENTNGDPNDGSGYPANGILTPPYGSMPVENPCSDNPLLAGCPPPPRCQPPLDCGVGGASGGSSNELQDSAGSGGAIDRGSNETGGHAGSSDAGAVLDAGAKDAGADTATDDAAN